MKVKMEEKNKENHQYMDVFIGKIKKTLLGKILPLFILFGMPHLHVLAQIIKPKYEVDSIKSNIVKFLINEKALNNDFSLQDFSKRVFVVEAVNRTTLDGDKKGLYIFSVSTSHSKKYFLIKDNLEHKILDPDELGMTLKYVTDLLIKYDYTETEIINYIEAIIKTYNYNQNRYPGRIK